MKKVLLVATLGALAAGLPGKEPGESLVAHEWGTFTSVALDTGAPARWAPWKGPVDLPCFVHTYNPEWKWVMDGLVRMETPIIYFYTSQRQNVSVDVDFPKGLVTEWYPQASGRVRNGTRPKEDAPATPEGGGIRWDVELLPGSTPALPTGPPNHYFAARTANATSLRAGGETENLLFYRGVGNFAPPLRARFPGDGKLEISNAGPESIPAAIAFDNHDGQIGYRIIRNLTKEVSIDPPTLTANPQELHQALQAELIATGLYEKEAAAMIETWRDSWFEEGTRVFYIVPRAEVDRVLPLTITPRPASVERVFVGRMDVLSPWMESAIRDADQRGDLPALKKYGRFLAPFAAQLDLTGTPAMKAAQHELGIDYYNTKCAE